MPAEEDGSLLVGRMKNFKGIMMSESFACQTLTFASLYQLSLDTGQNC
jgi:hypothetical protein